MKTTVINGHKEVDKIMVIMDMYKEYVPIFYNSKNYKNNIITAIYSNPEYHDDWIGFIKFAKENELITPNEFEREEMKILFNNDTGDMPISDTKYYFEELLEGI